MGLGQTAVEMTADQADAHPRAGPSERRAMRGGTVSPRGQPLVKLDPLTQVLTPEGLADALDIEFKHSSRVGILPTAILLSCGEPEHLHTHQAEGVADAVIGETAHRIRAVLRGSDAVARVRADAFLIVLGETGYWEALRVAERLRRRVTAPVPVVTGDLVPVEPTLAVVSISDAAMAVEDIVMLALEALARSKAAEARLQPGGSRAILDLLANAQTFRVIREPIIHLSSGRVTGYELLTRTTIEALELPADFLRVALVTDTLTQTDLMCLQACVAERQQWGGAAVDFHMNLFPSTILHTPPERILNVLGGFPDLHRVCVEITEHQFFGDRPRLRAHLTVLRNAGVRIALDDVGFGRTSLELLVLLAPDIVKIDRAFVKSASMDAAQSAEFRRLVDVIRALGATAIAEGIETPAEAQAIQAMGVDYGQGFLWPAAAGRGAGVGP